MEIGVDIRLVSDLLSGHMTGALWSVLCAFLEEQTDTGRAGWFTVKRVHLMAKLGIEERTYRRVVSELVDAGLMIRKPRVRETFWMNPDIWIWAKSPWAQDRATRLRILYKAAWDRLVEKKFEKLKADLLAGDAEIEDNPGEKLVQLKAFRGGTYGKKRYAKA